MVAEQGGATVNDRLNGWGCLLALTISIAMWVVILGLTAKALQVMTEVCS